jgi:hypothetical protein
MVAHLTLRERTDTTAAETNAQTAAGLRTVADELPETY